MNPHRSFLLTLHTMARRLALLSVILSLIALTASPQIRVHRFSNISVEQGLSHFRAYDILQDRTGYLWVATMDGLDRYDGYGFTVFRHDDRDSGSISDSHPGSGKRRSAPQWRLRSHGKGKRDSETYGCRSPQKKNSGPSVHKLLYGRYAHQEHLRKAPRSHKKLCHHKSAEGTSRLAQKADAFSTLEKHISPFVGLQRFSDFFLSHAVLPLIQENAFTSNTV